MADLTNANLCWEPFEAGSEPRVLWRITCLRAVNADTQFHRCTHWFMKKRDCDEEAQRLAKLGGFVKHIVIRKYEMAKRKQST